MLAQNLISGERVHAALNGRENRTLVLTHRRLLLVSSALMLRGCEALQLLDLVSINSGALALGLTLANGDEYEVNFWPTSTNRAAAEHLVRKARELQTALRAPAADNAAGGNAAEQLATYARLHQQGVLSKAEFDAQKARLLAP